MEKGYGYHTIHEVHANWKELKRDSNEYIKFQATPGYVLCWISILILIVGPFGSVKN